MMGFGIRWRGACGGAEQGTRGGLGIVPGSETLGWTGKKQRDTEQLTLSGSDIIV